MTFEKDHKREIGLLLLIQDLSPFSPAHNKRDKSMVGRSRIRDSFKYELLVFCKYFDERISL